jgi:hypothetical protein
MQIVQAFVDRSSVCRCWGSFYGCMRSRVSTGAHNKFELWFEFHCDYDVLVPCPERLLHEVCGGDILACTRWNKLELREPGSVELRGPNVGRGLP